LPRPKGEQVGTAYLAIQEAVFPFLQVVHKLDERIFGRVAHGMVHTFPAEYMSEVQSVYPAHKFVPLPGFEGMGDPHPE